VKVLLDLDGVITNFVGAACEFHRVANPYARSENLGVYNIEKLTGIYGDDFWGGLDMAFWSNLPMMPFSGGIINLLEETYGQENICILTSPIRTAGCINGKMAWIKRNMPKYRRQFLIGPMKEACAHPNSILFDDCDANIERFEAAGGNAFLIPAPWNSKHSELPVVALEDFLGGK